MPSFLLQQYAYRIQRRPPTTHGSSLLDQYSQPGPPGLTVLRSLPGWRTFQEVGIISPYLLISRNGNTESIRHRERTDLRLLNQAIACDVTSSEHAITIDELSTIYRSSGLSKGLPSIRLIGDSFGSLGPGSRVLLGQNSDRKVEFGLLKSVLSHCDHSHEFCRARRSQKRKYLGIRLVDVVDCCIIHTTTASKYFALSYVWRGGSDDIYEASEHCGILLIGTNIVVAAANKYDSDSITSLEGMGGE